MYPHIHLTDGLSLPTYLVIISLVYCLALVWVVRRANRQERDRARALDIALILMVAGFLGARLFHVLWEMPDYYLARPLDLFKVWQGGFVFYGGALAGFFAAAGWVKLKGDDWRAWADFYAPIVAMAYALGRLACFFNGCCYGAECALPWSVAGRHPTPLYATLWELSAGFALLALEARRHQYRRLASAGNLFLIWVMSHALGRLVMEQFRADDRGWMPLGWSVSSWISLILLLSAAGGLLRHQLKNSHS